MVGDVAGYLSGSASWTILDYVASGGDGDQVAHAPPGVRQDGAGAKQVQGLGLVQRDKQEPVAEPLPKTRADPFVGAVADVKVKHPRVPRRIEPQHQIRGSDPLI